MTADWLVSCKLYSDCLTAPVVFLAQLAAIHKATEIAVIRFMFYFFHVYDNPFRSACRKLPTKVARQLQEYWRKVSNYY
jgi:hypothetical protein